MKTLFLFLLLAPALLTAQTAPATIDPIANYIALAEKHTLLQAENDRLTAELAAKKQSLDLVISANTQIAAQKEALTAQVTALQNLLTEWQTYATALKQQTPAPAAPVYTYTVATPTPALNAREKFEQMQRRYPAPSQPVEIEISTGLGSDGQPYNVDLRPGGRIEITR